MCHVARGTFTEKREALVDLRIEGVWHEVMRNMSVSKKRVLREGYLVS
jgi:hypothetical protein